MAKLSYIISILSLFYFSKFFRGHIYRSSLEDKQKQLRDYLERMFKWEEQKIFPQKKSNNLRIVSSWRHHCKKSERLRKPVESNPGRGRLTQLFVLSPNHSIQRQVLTVDKRMSMNLTVCFRPLNKKTNRIRVKLPLPRNLWRRVLITPKLFLGE